MSALVTRLREFTQILPEIGLPMPLLPVYPDRPQCTSLRRGSDATARLD